MAREGGRARLLTDAGRAPAAPLLAGALPDTPPSGAPWPMDMRQLLGDSGLALLRENSLQFNPYASASALAKKHAYLSYSLVSRLAVGQYPARSDDEERFALLGLVREKIWMAFYTRRSGRIRLISW